MSTYPKFLQLFEQIHQFLQVCPLVPTQLSEFGQTHPAAEIDKEYWAKHLPNEVQQFYERLKLEVANGVEKNKQTIDSDLEFFRTLSRYISEAGPGPCIWSAYYPEIKKLKSQIAVQLGQIDKKYTLGKYLMREKIAQYRRPG